MTQPGNSWLRGLWPVLLLFAGALFIRFHMRAEVLPPHKPLSSFPSAIGHWTGTTLTIPSEDRAVLGPGHFLERDYEEPSHPDIDFFVAFFPHQRTGDTIHSPKHCLPGAGWSPMDSRVIRVPWGDGRILTANLYVLQLGLKKELVIYWFQSHGRTVASEYLLRYYLVEDALRINRTDGALVRIITGLADHESVRSGKHRALAFAKQILPLLGHYIPN